MTALINSTAIFRCPIVSDLEPYIQWVKVAEYPGDQEDSPKGTLLQVQPQFIAVEGPGSLWLLTNSSTNSFMSRFVVVLTVNGAGSTNLFLQNFSKQ